MQNLYILLAFLLSAIALLLGVSIKYLAGQKRVLQFHDTNNELRENLY